ncbi:MAG: hypothetical protein H0T78_00740 [Longispora sp.]|nr:hypothetical protein [Longispora sp. (in: high G+C Gram-positive bacteria)]
MPGDFAQKFASLGVAGEAAREAAGHWDAGDFTTAARVAFENLDYFDAPENVGAFLFQVQMENQSAISYLLDFMTQDVEIQEANEEMERILQALYNASDTPPAEAESAAQAAQNLDENLTYFGLPNYVAADVAAEVTEYVAAENSRKAASIMTSELLDSGVPEDSTILRFLKEIKNRNLEALEYFERFVVSPQVRAQDAEAMMNRIADKAYYESMNSRGGTQPVSTTGEASVQRLLAFGMPETVVRQVLEVFCDEDLSLLSDRDVSDVLHEIQTLNISDEELTEAARVALQLDTPTAPEDGPFVPFLKQVRKENADALDYFKKFIMSPDIEAEEAKQVMQEIVNNAPAP